MAVAPSMLREPLSALEAVERDCVRTPADKRNAEQAKRCEAAPTAGGLIIPGIY
jgi:hypothetical protein